MAGTGWLYWCPYDPDADTALRQLRQEVFAKGEFELPGDMLEDLPDETPEILADKVAKLRAMAAIARGMDEAFAEDDEDLAVRRRQSDKMDAYLDRLEKKGAAEAAKVLRPARRPATIEEALEIAEESGTHSILDIERTAETPDFGTATALDNDELTRLFGTTRPTAEMVTEAEADDRLSDLCEIWSAVYFVVHENNEPRQYVFVGSSGD